MQLPISCKLCPRACGANAVSEADYSALVDYAIDDYLFIPPDIKAEALLSRLH
jgi:formate hydrogenlyase subunit 6/NADH:ubiquinone oxidoreductase subunit I